MVLTKSPSIQPYFQIRGISFFLLYCELKKKNMGGDSPTKKTKTTKTINEADSAAAGAAKEKEPVEYEVRLKAVSAIAHPLASKKLTKKVYKTIKKGESLPLFFFLHLYPSTSLPFFTSVSFAFFFLSALFLCFFVLSSDS